MFGGVLLALLGSVFSFSGLSDWTQSCSDQLPSSCDQTLLS